MNIKLNNRILVVGIPGAGKSTLSNRLGEITGLPVIHLDKLFWRPGWVKPDILSWREKVKELVGGERWIIDGNYNSSLDIRLPRAESIIMLDFPTLTAIRYIIKRVYDSYGKIRPDSAPGCPEKIDFEFLRFVAGFRKKIRPKVLTAIETYYRGDAPIIFRNRRETVDFVYKLFNRSNN